MPMPPVRILSRVVPLLLAGSLLACGTVSDATRGLADVLTLYKPEVVQGNVVTAEQVAALRPGMTRLQVRDILGTPMMASLFHADRWDYVFTMKRQGVEPQHYRLTTHFEGDRLARFDGDDMPSEAEFVERISRKRKIKVPELEASPEQLERFDPPETLSSLPSAATPDAPAAPGQYPPLEDGR